MHDTSHPHAATLSHPDGSPRFTNRLIDTTSPYLLQHAHNPVDWFPWGEEAFEEARRLDKPIFLSVGYATCYWCHVMERQVFEHPELARQMNEQFVNVKVDREQRPDVDELYMTATQLMTMRGGWPMSIFLTPPMEDAPHAPGLKPFWAGTYIPPEPMGGMPGFGQVLQQIHDAWQSRREDVLETADRIADAVSDHLRYRDLSGPLNAELVQQAASQLLRTYDREHGGFGSAPKFPMPANLSFLMRVHEHADDPRVWDAIAHTLGRMARGGIYNQVGGGFHRYSVDEHWTVPHFEKMLYDNGQLIELYVQAGRLTPAEGEQAFYKDVVRQSCDYVLREMVDQSGAFYSAQDAEVDGREGVNYLWTEQQVRTAIDDEALADLAVKVYGLDRGTNFRDPHDSAAEPANVLEVPTPLPELAEQRSEPVDELREKLRRINAQLLAARDQRKQPRTDDKVIVGWNGMMIAALARAGAWLNEPRYIEAAARAAGAICAHMSEPAGALWRTMRGGQVSVPAYLEDYAFFAHGLLALHEARPAEGEHLALAQQTMQSARERFAAEDAGAGGYYDTRAEQGDLFVRIRSMHDGVIPTGNSQMAHNLLSLYEQTADEAYLRQAIADMRSMGRPMAERGVSLIHMQHALLRAIALSPSSFPAEVQATPDQPAEPVAIEVEPQPVDLSSGRALIEVRLTVPEGYHINAREPGNANVMPTQIELAGASGLEVIDVQEPPAMTLELPGMDPPLRVHAGQVRFGVTLRRSDGASAEDAKLVVRWQRCTDAECLPAEERVVPLSCTT